MIKRMVIMLILLALVAGGFAAFKIHSMHAGMAAMQSSWTPPSVSTVKAEIQDWQPQLSSVGSLRAVNGADMSSELAGIVEKINFDSGADVEKGAVLIELRAEDDIAKLQALQATAKLAEITYQRDLRQLKEQAVSQAAVDNDVAVLDSAKAQVGEQQAVVEKKIIRAPFAGHLGVRHVDIGQYLSPGTAIVSLQQLDPIYVDFAMPEQSLPRIAEGQQVSLRVDAFPDQVFPGKVTALNSRVDEATRNISIRATFENPDHKLLPGMFGSVSVDVEKPVKYITLPQTAIVFNTYGNTVYVIQRDGDKVTVQQSVVSTGETRGDQVAVLSGIKEGDEVVTSGQVKLRNGVSVAISNDNQPPADADPKPHEQ